MWFGGSPVLQGGSTHAELAACQHPKRRRIRGNQTNCSGLEMQQNHNERANASATEAGAMCIQRGESMNDLPFSVGYDKSPTILARAGKQSAKHFQNEWSLAQRADCLFRGVMSNGELLPSTWPWRPWLKTDMLVYGWHAYFGGVQHSATARISFGTIWESVECRGDCDSNDSHDGGSASDGDTHPAACVIPVPPEWIEMRRSLNGLKHHAKRMAATSAITAAMQLSLAKSNCVCTYLGQQMPEGNYVSDPVLWEPPARKDGSRNIRTTSVVFQWTIVRPTFEVTAQVCVRHDHASHRGVPFPNELRCARRCEQIFERAAAQSVSAAERRCPHGTSATCTILGKPTLSGRHRHPKAGAVVLLCNEDGTAAAHMLAAHVGGTQWLCCIKPGAWAAARHGTICVDDFVLKDIGSSCASPMHSTPQPCSATGPDIYSLIAAHAHETAALIAVGCMFAEKQRAGGYALNLNNAMKCFVQDPWQWQPSQQRPNSLVWVLWTIHECKRDTRTCVGASSSFLVAVSLQNLLARALIPVPRELYAAACQFPQRLSALCARRPWAGVAVPSERLPGYSGIETSIPESCDGDETATQPLAAQQFGMQESCQTPGACPGVHRHIKACDLEADSDTSNDKASAHTADGGSTAAL